jgi:hypothetical protein
VLSISESAVQTSLKWNKTNDTYLKKVFKPPMQIGENASGNLKKHEKICRGPKKLNIAPNNLNSIILLFDMKKGM